MCRRLGRRDRDVGKLLYIGEETVKWYLKLLYRKLGVTNRMSAVANFIFNLPNLFAMHRPPMLILGAEDDVLVPAFLVQTTAQTYGQRAHIFRDMGHAVSHEKEWPLVAATLRDWLDELRP